MKGLLIFACVIGALVFGIKSCTASDWYQADLQAERQRTEAAKVPRVIREADGCKVYAFKDGDRWHYFTRCPNSQTTTDSTYEVRAGKSTRQESESIETRTGK